MNTISGLRVVVIGPPLLAEGACVLLRDLPFISSVISVSEAAPLVAGELVVALPTSGNSPLTERWARPGHNILFVDALGYTTEQLRVANHHGIRVLLSVSDDIPTLRAGFLAGALGTAYRSPRLPTSE